MKTIISAIIVLAALLSAAPGNAKDLGPSFGTEVAAAGLAGLPFSWGADGVIQGAERLTPAQRATLDAVVAAHDPTKVDPSATVANQPRRARIVALQTSVKAATTVAQLRQILLDLIDEIGRQ